MRPCGCGGGVRVEVDGETLTAADVETMLSGSFAMQFGSSIERLITEKTGKTRSERRKVNRRNGLTRRILRDQAIRHLCDKRGLSVRAAAADLGVGRGTVARALATAGRSMTRRDIERLRVGGYVVKSIPLAEIRRILRHE